MENSDGFEFESFDSRTRSSNSSNSATSSKDSCSSPVSFGWPIKKDQMMNKCDNISEEKSKSNSCVDGEFKIKKTSTQVSEMEMMKERFSKLLLGEDMSGSGKGVCTALAISNAITNLCATAFGQLWRLEPLPCEKKQMWKREMECLLCVSDYIVEFKPSWQTLADGSKLEIMTCRPRSDIYVNLPALKKLDNMLLGILESFTNTNFWYVDKGITTPESDGLASFNKPLQRQEDKWWLPVPRVPAGGLEESERKRLNHKREPANQILKAAMAINSVSLSEMEVPDSYLESLPKNGRACLGDVIYQYITSEKFSAECLLDCVDLSSEHVALELANRVESAIHMWRKKPPPAKTSWDVVKDLMADAHRRDLLADRAESLLLSLKHRFPCLTQTSLDTTKIQFNKMENSDGFEFESFDSRTRSSNSSNSATSSKDSCSSPVSFAWPIKKDQMMNKCGDVSEEKSKSNSCVDGEFKIKKTTEMEMMKERFSKLLLGEDMSGSGKGVCTALAISNAITNLCATAFGQLWRLEPLPSEKKQMWKREMECLLCVSDYIVEFKPSWQTLADGSKLEIMTCRPRSDIYVNLPALKKLDNMLLGILESFTNTEFWYVDKGITTPESDGLASFNKPLQRQEDKWWLPVPRVPAGGLEESERKRLNHKRESANQILKAAMAINSVCLSEMEVPESYLESLPKNGRACLGDVIYQYITSEKFSAECLLDCLDLSSEHVALELANRVESAIHMWRKKPPPAKSSWDVVKDLMADAHRRDLLADRAESLLLSLKHRFPCLTQTSLDTTKIQFNKDVGKAILESYSRVLESLAFNVVARIDDLLYVDDLSKQSETKPLRVSTSSHKRVSVSTTSSSPYRPSFGTPKFSPGPLVSPSPAKGDRTPFLTSNGNSNKSSRGCGVRRALTSYLGGETRVKSLEGPGCGSRSSVDGGPSQKENRTPVKLQKRIAELQLD